MSKHAASLNMLEIGGRPHAPARVRRGAAAEQNPRSPPSTGLCLGLQSTMQTAVECHPRSPKPGQVIHNVKFHS